MTRTESSATRDKQRTRKAILDAAMHLIAEQGSKASQADIAAAAKVTQSGLRHHFPTRDDLIYGVAVHTIELMWASVHSKIDLSENRPGKFTRGYIRALTGDDDIFDQNLDPIALANALHNSSALDQFYAEDAKRWDDAFAADGLPRARVLVIQSAAEGLAIARSTPYLAEEDVALVRAELLAMTEQ